MVDLAKLVVSMEMENAKLLSKLDQSNKKLKRFEKNSNKAAKAIKQIGQVGAVALGVAAAGMVKMIESTLTANDKLAKMSQVTGLTVENLSQLEHSAGLSGISLDTVAKGVGKLQRGMFDANNGLLAYQEGFADLGVNIADSDGQLRSTNDVMMDAADRFAEMEDGARKSALAQILFGKAGKEMIPFLNEGSKGIREMNDEADRLGKTLSGETAAASERVNDNFDRLKTISAGLAQQVTMKLLPMIEKASEALLEWGSDTDSVSEAVDFLTNSVKVTVSAGLLLKGIFQAIAYAGASMAAALVTAARGDFSIAADILAQGAEDSDKAWSDAMKSIDKVWDDTPKKIAAEAPETAKKIASPVVEAAKLVGLSGKDIVKQTALIKSEIEKAANDLESTGKDFQDRIDGLLSPAGVDGADLTVLDASMGVLDAEKALRAGDFDGAVEKAKEAFNLLESMKSAGTESELILANFGEKLKSVAEQAGADKLANISAKLDIDEAASMNAVMSQAQKSQEYLTANPLTQIIETIGVSGESSFSDAANDTNFNQDIIPQRASEAVQQSAPLTPVNITMPNGDVVPMYADPGIAEQTQRDIAREAQKRGRR